MNSEFTLMLFSTDPALIRWAVAAGVGGIVVDWEHIGKQHRQSSVDTQINHDTVEDLRSVRACTDAPVVCRINSVGTTTNDEVEQAIAAGTDEILLPMVRTVAEVEAVLSQVRGRCGVGILVETLSAVRLVKELSRLPLSRVYVGLNDLAIERKSPTIFAPLADGTLEHVRRQFRVPFGFGGLTLPDRGHPIPCRLLMSEMARLRCDFSFLRRSFYIDIRGRDLSLEVPRIHSALQEAGTYSEKIVEQNRTELLATIATLSKPESEPA